MSVILSAKGIITPLSSKSHIAYTFNIDKNIDKLNIDFSYYPKKLEDMKKAKSIIEKSIHEYIEVFGDKFSGSWQNFLPVLNLLTISIDDPYGFRGCSHRHDHIQHLILSEEETSPGFMKSPIVKGLWKVTISVHAVVTDTCEYNLCIWEGDSKDAKNVSM